MNNAELTARVAIRTSISKASGGGAVTAVFSTIANALASTAVRLTERCWL